MTTKFMTISKAVKNEILTALPKKSSTLDVIINDLESTFEISLYGMGLVHQMEDLFSPYFKWIEADCSALARQLDCFKSVKFEAEACIIVSRSQMTPPELKIIFEKQSVAKDRH